MMYLELLWTFFKIGLFTIGGGYAMLPMIESEVVGKGWISQAQIVNFIAVSESTPGPFAINMATYIGNIKGGILGATCATLGVVLPSFIIILIVAKCYAKFKTSFAVKSVMSGLKPAVIGLITAAILSVGMTVFFPTGVTFAVCLTGEFIVSAVIFVLMLVLILKVKVHPIIIVVLSAILGIAAGFLIL